MNNVLYNIHKAEKLKGKLPPQKKMTPKLLNKELKERKAAKQKFIDDVVNRSKLMKQEIKRRDRPEAERILSVRTNIKKDQSLLLALDDINHSKKKSKK